MVMLSFLLRGLKIELEDWTLLIWIPLPLLLRLPLHLRLQGFR